MARVRAVMGAEAAAGAGEPALRPPVCQGRELSARLRWGKLTFTDLIQNFAIRKNSYFQLVELLPKCFI